MKKLLALVLALVMTLSLCVVTSNAAYSDAADVDYKEAVDVMTAAGVFNGTDGKFNPKDILTREQAAKIVTYMLLGKKSADALVTIAAPFADVAADRWSAGSIAYCYNEGILAGVGNGMFAPASQLTGLAFAKMMLTALGYDAEIEGLTGTNWSINTAKLALTVGLTDDLDDVALSAPMTREQAAKMALNTELATMVEYPNASTIKVGNVEVTTSAKASEVDTASLKGKLTLGDPAVVEFAEKYAKKLDNESTTDKFGRPATKWTWDGESVGTYADKAAKTITLAKAKNVKTVLTGSDYLDYDADDILATAKLWQNGVNTKTNYVTFDEEVTLGIGDIVEVFENNNGDVANVVVRTYTAAKISAVSKSLSNTFTSKGAAYGVSFAAINGVQQPTATLYDAYKGDSTRTLPGFDADTYVKGAIVAVAIKNGNNAVVLDSYIPEVVTGKMTAYTNAENATVEGTKYTFATSVASALTTFDFDVNQNLYLDKAGYVIASDTVGTEKLENVYYVVGVYKDTKAFGTNVYYAQALKLDGTTENVKLESTSADAMAKKYDVNGATGTTHFYPYAGTGAAGKTSMEAKTLYAVPGTPLYTFADADNDGEFVGTAYAGTDAFAYIVSDLNGDVNGSSISVKFDTVADANIKGDGKTYGNSLAKKYIDENTQFVSVKGHGDTLKVKTATGLMKMVDDNATYVVVIYKDKADVASYVVYYGENLSTAASTSDLVYVAKQPTSMVTVKNGVSAWDATVYYMETKEAKSLTLKNGTPMSTDTFYKIDSVDEDGLVTLTATGVGAEISSTVTSATTGWDKTVNVTSTRNYKLTATNYEDIAFADAKFVDSRTTAEKDLDVYSGDIENADTFAAAVEEGTVTATLYVEDGKVTFVNVTAVANKQYNIAAATLAGASTGMSISTVQTVGADNDVIDIYVTIAAGTVIDTTNDKLTLSHTSGAKNLSAAQTLTLVAAPGTTAQQVLHFTAQVNNADVVGLKVTVD